MGTVKGMVTGDYGGDSGYAEKKCYPTYETWYRKQCEDYNEKVCRTTHNEQCQDVASKRCKAIKTSRHERKCHDVNELLCSLKESVLHKRFLLLLLFRSALRLQNVFVTLLMIQKLQSEMISNVSVFQILIVP